MRISKTLILAAIAAGTIAGCNKKTSDNNSQPSTETEFAYTMSYDSVVRMPANSTHYFYFTIKVLGGNIVDNSIQFSLVGLPGQASCTPASITVTQMLGGTFEIHAGDLQNLDYPFRLKATSTKYGDQYYNMILRITPIPDYAPLLAGTYDTSYDYCLDEGIINYPATVSTVTDTPYLMKIANMQNLGSGFVVRAYVSNAITVPYQTVSGKNIWGTGTFSQDARPGHAGDYMMEIKDTIAVGTDTTYCTMHIEH